MGIRPETKVRVILSQWERGGALIACIVSFFLATIMVTGALSLARIMLRSTASVDQNLTQEAEAERSFSLALNWLRDNSNSLVYPFIRTNFDKSLQAVAISAGTNDTIIPVESTIRLKNVTSTPLLTNTDSLGSPVFPPCFELGNETSSKSFDAVARFRAADLGSAMVKVTVVGVSPPGPAGVPPSGVNLAPVFRIDAVTSPYSGAHVYGYVVGAIVSEAKPGLYGTSSVHIDDSVSCDSFDSSKGIYGAANQKAGCSIQSKGWIKLDAYSVIYGETSSLGALTVAKTAKVCADFVPGCPNSGVVCQGSSSCPLPNVPDLLPWSSLCPGDQGNLTVSGEVTLKVLGDSPNERCWRDVKVDNDSTLVLTTTKVPYYFASLDVADRGNKKKGPGYIRIRPETTDGTVTLYLNKASKIDPLEADNFINETMKPASWVVYYQGSDLMRLDLERISMYVNFIAPAASIRVRDTGHFYGNIVAKSIQVNNSIRLHLDERNAAGGVIDMTLNLRQYVRRYR